MNTKIFHLVSCQKNQHQKQNSHVDYVIILDTIVIIANDNLVKINEFDNITNMDNIIQIISMLYIETPTRKYGDPKIIIHRVVKL